MILSFKNNMTCILGVNSKWEDINDDWLICCATDREAVNLIDLILM